MELRLIYTISTFWIHKTNVIQRELEGNCYTTEIERQDILPRVPFVLLRQILKKFNNLSTVWNSFGFSFKFHKTFHAICSRYGNNFLDAFNFCEKELLKEDHKVWFWNNLSNVFKSIDPPLLEKSDSWQTIKLKFIKWHSIAMVTWPPFSIVKKVNRCTHVV